jgi:hypothetical protein
MRKYTLMGFEYGRAYGTQAHIGGTGGGEASITSPLALTPPSLSNCNISANSSVFKLTITLLVTELLVISMACGAFPSVLSITV